MDPITGGLIAGGASLLGSFFGSDTAKENTQANIAMQRETNQMSMAEAQKNRDFTQQMSSTAYQRASQDMEAAGLNKAAMFGHGAAASTPGGTQPSLGTAKSENVSAGAGLGDAVTKAVSSAVSVKTMDKMSSEMANLEVENRRLAAAVDQVKATTATERRREDYVKQMSDSEYEDVLRKRRDVPRQNWDAIKHLDYSSIPDAARKAGNIAGWGGEKLSDTVSPLLSTAKGVRVLIPTRSTSQRSRVDSSGKSFDEFWENRTGMSR